MFGSLSTFFFYICFFPLMAAWSVMGGLYHFLTGKYCFWVVRRYGRNACTLLRIFKGIKVKFHSETEFIEKPCLIISNHISTIDAFLLPIYFKQNNITYIVKKMLVQWKSFPFNFGCKGMGAIPISRTANSGDYDFMQKEIKKKIEQNTSVVIFANGTRSKDIESSIKIPPSGVLIAKKLKVDILPVFMGTDSWGNGKYLKDFGPILNKDVEVYIGQTISADAKHSTKEIHNQILKFYEESLNKFKKKD